jgi:acyl-CoA reductase-like NAD-dependent aldehyde dehydrogenase
LPRINRREIIMETPIQHAWICGRSHDGGLGQPVEITNPWSGMRAARIQPAGVELVEMAVGAAAEAFRRYRSAGMAERSTWLSNAAAELERASESAVEAAVADIGKPRRAARFEIGRSIAFLRACARSIHEVTGEVLPLDSAANGTGLHGFTRRVPYGVVAAVTPFNAPANLLVQKLGPALVTGNAVIAKPSLEGTRVALIIADCFARAGLPAGLLGILPGGSEDALALAAHRDTAWVTLTGGAAAGEALARAAGPKRFVGELGGNSANIVCQDANLEDAAARIVPSAFEASGQQCISAQRVIVEAPVFDRFLELFLAATRRLRTGDPDVLETDLGPVVNARAADRIESMIEEARARGARIICGPNRKGCVIDPTIIVDAPEDARVVREEVFGPVAVILSARDPDDATRLANGSDLGLQASCFTNSLDTAFKVADALNVGAVWVNEGSRFRLDNYPFGGMGRSGHGREGVRYAMEEYTQWKFTGVRLAPRSDAWAG